MALPVACWLYLHYGHPPAALTAGLPTGLRPARPVALPRRPPGPLPEHAVTPPSAPTQAAPQPPFGISEDVFESGARTYAAHCAGCHGAPGHDAAGAGGAVQLWKRQPHSAQVGVSAQTAGVIFTTIEKGVSAKAAGGPAQMPPYQHVLTSTQMWQVALLLKSADQPIARAGGRPSPPHALRSLCPENYGKRSYAQRHFPFRNDLLRHLSQKLQQNRGIFSGARITEEFIAKRIEIGLVSVSHSVQFVFS